jgi:16S rRNA (adenine1518-N6/adenine1519-N6)-dimethyltransferase
LQITPNADKRAAIPDRAFFHDFVRAIFCHRRKLLRGVLVSAFKDQLSKSQADEVLAEMGLDETARAEQLDPAAMLKLCEVVRKRL